MPQKEIDKDSWFIHPVTGYLSSNDKRHKFTNQIKVLLLEKIRELKDVADACKAVGISRRILAPHLRADWYFRKDFQETVAETKDLEKQKQAEAVSRLWAKLNSK